MVRFVSLCAALMALLVSAPALAATQVSNSDYVCGRGPFYGRSDGVCYDASTKAAVVTTNGSVEAALSRSLYVEHFYDWLGADGTSEPWAEKDTSAAGAPVLAIKGDADHGLFELTLAATNEAETITLFWNDELNIDSDDGPIMVVRLQAAVLPAAAGETFVFGFASAQNDTADTVGDHAWFRVEADADLMVESDEGTTDDDDNDTAVDLVAATFYEFMIDCSDPTDCDFFYRATLGGDWTELLSTTAFSVGADNALQPFFQLLKASGTGVPSVLIDYVRVYWARS